MSTRYQHMLERMQHAILSGDATARDLLIDRDDFPVDVQMNIYQHGYRVRMAKVVRDDFPALSHYARDEVMNAWVNAFVEATPSQHYNLDTYPHGFPEFLVSQTKDPFALELANLEGAIKEVYMMPESAPFDPLTLNTGMETAILIPRTASRLLAFNHTVNDYLSNFRLHGNAAAPHAQKTFCFVYRHRHNVRRADFSAEEHALMQALATGKVLADVLSGVPHLEDATVQAAFTRFVSEGMLTRS